ncbi:MAG: DUF4271 domain-containing protein [Bacteroidaceae bacterium]|nr:DUF4271 domain-containing protein [Bacteroidaceae bacterium]
MQQDDILYYNFDLSQIQVDEEPVFHRPVTPYQAIKLLPSSASESEKDDIVQKYFSPVRVAPSQRPDTLYLPWLPSSRPTTVPSYRDGYFKGNPYLHPEQKITINGIPGDPVPYSLRSDEFVTSILLLSFFVAMYILTQSMHVLIMQLKNFFYNRDRNQIFTLKSDSEMKNQFYIVLLACFLMTLLFFNYTQERLTSVFNQVSPYLLLGLDMGIFLLFYLGKYACSMIFNWTFFSTQQRSQWMNAYNLMVLVQALCFMPVVLLVVYFDLSITVTIPLVLGIVCLTEILVIFKTKQIFFEYSFGIIHLFLYFCTLELVPLLFLWKTLVSANEYMIGYI